MDLLKKEQSVSVKEQTLAAKEEELAKAASEQRARLEQISGMTAEEAKKLSDRDHGE